MGPNDPVQGRLVKRPLFVFLVDKRSRSPYVPILFTVVFDLLRSGSMVRVRVFTSLSLCFLFTLKHLCSGPEVIYSFLPPFSASKFGVFQHSGTICLLISKKWQMFCPLSKLKQVLDTSRNVLVTLFVTQLWSRSKRERFNRVKKAQREYICNTSHEISVNPFSNRCC